MEAPESSEQMRKENTPGVSERSDDSGRQESRAEHVSCG